MNSTSFIPYNTNFEEMLLGTIASIVFKDIELAELEKSSEISLSEITEKPQYGYTESAQKEDTGIKYVRITDIQAGKIDWPRVPYCNCEEPDTYSLKENDILFARTGGTTGKSFIVKGVIPKSVFASYLIRIRTKPGIIPDFLYWFFQTKQYWSQVQKKKIGSAQPNVNGKKLSSLKLFLTEPKFQDVIASYLESYKQKIKDPSLELAIIPETFKLTKKYERALLKISELRKLQNETATEIEEIVPSILDRVFEN